MAAASHDDDGGGDDKTVHGLHLHEGSARW